MHRRSKWNGPIMFFAVFIYLAFLCLFAYQTWVLVQFLFQNDWAPMRYITLASFDIASAVWGFIDLMYAFANRAAKWIVKATWILTFICSLLASVLCFYIEFFTRFKVQISPVYVQYGMILSLAVLTLNLITLMLFLYLEWNSRHPHQDHIDYYERVKDGKEMRAQGWRKRGNSRRGSAQRDRVAK